MHSHFSFVNRRNALAAAIARDILNRCGRPRDHAPTCFTCGRSYSRGDGRFCSLSCRAAFDAGLPAYEPPNLDRHYNLPKGATGFYVDCAHCKQRFDSRGWRCCSLKCARKLRECKERDKLLADDPFRAVKRKCLDCGGDIPNWRKGRRVSKATRFCSARCQKKRRRNGGIGANEPTSDLSAETAKMCPENGASRAGPPKGSLLSEAGTSGEVAA
jgi:hypothetical protein